MSRLKIYIIGNGFDISHGLDTGYYDFYNFYIDKIKTEFANDVLDKKLKPNLAGIILKNVNNSTFISVSLNTRKLNSNDTLDHLTIYNNCEIHEHPWSIFRNVKNSNWWCDFEYEYFNLLKNSLKEGSKIDIYSVNQNLKVIKDELEEYLTEKTKNRELNKNYKDIFNQPWSVLQNKNNSLKNEVEVPDWTIILNFNYTKIPIDYYVESKKRIEIVNIHGQLNDASNPIIFGLGDEYSEEYDLFENTNNNEYLVNLKSNKYLLTDEYSKLIVATESFQEIKIDVLGHSCGLTDRSLLRELFESKKIKKGGIRLYHHNGKKSYSKTIYGISRLFNANIEMRTKVEKYNSKLVFPKDK